MWDIVGVWVLHLINNEDDECLPLLSFWRDVVNAIFLKDSKEGRLSSNHVGVRNIPSDVCYNNTKHQVKSENKAGVRCTKKILDAARQNVNLRDTGFEIFLWYAHGKVQKLIN